MSIKSVSASDVFEKNPLFHPKKPSKEHFSDFNEAVTTNSGAGFSRKVKKKDKGWINSRISLDLPVKDILNLSQKPPNSYAAEKQTTAKDKKLQKPPNSPAGRITSFLNSLFSHSEKKNNKNKKNKKECSVEAADDETTSPKRRVSISAGHLCSSSSPGFGTPRHHVRTPTKSYKELLMSFSKLNRRRVLKSAVSSAEKPVFEGFKDHEKWRSRNGVLEKQKDLVELKRFDESDDGEETDSSSDLFELQIYDLDYYSTGLPVYESTDIDSIKRRNSISNGPLSILKPSDSSSFSNS